MTYNPDIHHRNSVRLRSYDYRSAGAYFVTICTFQKEAILAEITNGVAHLKSSGESCLNRRKSGQKSNWTNSL
jgi:putative transposase